MRGPDNGYPWGILKTVFTERLRYLALRDSSNVKHSYPVRRMALSRDEAFSFLHMMEELNVEENAQALSHFLSHQRSAAEAFGNEELASLAEAYRPLSRMSNGGYTLQFPAFNTSTVIGLAGGEPRETP